MSSPMPPSNAPMPAPTDPSMGGAMITCPDCGSQISLSANHVSTPEEEAGESPETQAMEENMGQEMPPQGDEVDQTVAKYQGANMRPGAKGDPSKQGRLLRAYKGK